MTFFIIKNQEVSITLSRIVPILHGLLMGKGLGLFWESSTQGFLAPSF
jgi:hypothetical protein